MNALMRTAPLTEAEAVQTIESMFLEWENENDGWNTVARGNSPATYSGGFGSQVYRQFTAISDRDEGRYWPYFRDEMDLARMRSQCRMLGTFTSVAVGAMQALNCYVMQGEWEFKIEAKDGVEAPEDLIKECQVILDANLERNAFIGDLDGEIHDSCREDGDCIVAGYGTTDGLTDLRRLNADNCREPASATELNYWLDFDDDKSRTSWTFGVATRYCDRQKHIDHTKPVGLHVVFDDGGKDFDFLPSFPTHIGDDDLDGKFGQLVSAPGKPRAAKRWVSDYLPVLTDIEREHKLSGNLAISTAVMAAVPWIEEFPPGTTKEQVEGMLASSLNSLSRKLGGRRASTLDPSKPKKLYPAGTVLQVNDGKKYVAPPAASGRTNIFMDVCSHLGRRIGLRWLMPEYMITGDASNAAFASTIVSESPFVKRREADQRYFVTQWKALVWKMLKIAIDAGRFLRWRVSTLSELMGLIDVKITPPPVATRQKAELLNELTSAYDRGAIDLNEFRTGLKMEPKPELEGVTKSQGNPLDVIAGAMAGQAPQQSSNANGDQPKPQSDDQRPASQTRQEAMALGVLIGKNLTEARTIAAAAIDKKPEAPAE